MLWRAVVILIGGAFVVYRVVLWRDIRGARRAGDLERERHLRGRSLRVLKGVTVCVVVFVVLLSVLVWRNSK
jgi:hypothetical protein